MADPNTRQSQAGTPDQFAGMANLMAHPLAGMATASAIGFGVASHAFGLWMGAVAGAAEASRRLLNDEREPAPADRPIRLKLVSSRPAETSGKKAVRKTEPRQIDDLKAILGIGPKLEQVLNARGISSYEQVATLNAAEIARLDEELGFGGRIQRDDWVGQARSLASAPASGSKGAGRKRS